MKVRVRFAPSPTGPLHIGGVRTALYNYLFAKKHNGTFLLRIEDTDQTRFVEGAEEYIIESLKWCGIEIDEGVTKNGPYAPYKQSERKHLYKKYAEKLVDDGHAYYAFDTPEELDVLRKRLENEKASNFSYSASSRIGMVNSLTLSDDDVSKRISDGTPFVIRFKMPENEVITFKDIIRGDVSVNTATLDDKVLFKSDGMPTYHLANVVDDHLMEISHVIRGEEWLPSLALHVLLYRSFNWQDSMPEFAHLPLLLKPTGKGKLSKRDGDKMGFPVFPLEWKGEDNNTISGYRESGYLPDAFINILALLGWNSGTEQEIFSKEELIELFSLEKVGKSGARFDPEKTKWFNQQYIINKDDDTLAKLLMPLLEQNGIITDIDFLAKVCALIKERAMLLSDMVELSKVFFKSPDSFDEKLIRKKWKENTTNLVNELSNKWNLIENFTADNIKEALSVFTQEKEIGFGQIMLPMRILLTGSGSGPDLFEMASLIGKKEVMKRINEGIQLINK